MHVYTSKTSVLRLIEAYSRMSDPGVTEVDAAPPADVVMQCAMNKIKDKCKLT